MMERSPALKVKLRKREREEEGEREREKGRKYCWEGQERKNVPVGGILQSVKINDGS